MADTAVVEAAAAEGVRVLPLSRQRIRPRGPTDRDALLLGYGGFTNARIRRGARRLRAAIERCRL